MDGWAVVMSDQALFLHALWTWWNTMDMKWDGWDVQKLAF